MPTAAEYREQLNALLPPGQAFPRDPGTTLHDLLDGMSVELARLDARGSVLPQEVNPATAAELLPDWERVAGLPDKCSGVLEETLQGRRNALLTKLTSTGGQSPAYFIELAASLGYTVTIEEFRPFRAGRSVAGNALTNGPWVHTWLVMAPQSSITDFRAGRSAAGERLRTWGNDTLECKINQLKPAHTIALFAYGG
ncbi:Phage tail protein [Pseudomonas sp. IT-P74]|uniref:YmfQ family protein n=1 Tax=Pseudomonas sp. IT-P74 TaxID=3026445 RepID=UPI0039E1999C